MNRVNNDIKEQMVLSKLSDSIIIDKLDNKPVVILNGLIYPVGIFISCLARYGLWKVRFSKSVWYEINISLIKLWTTLDVLPNRCSMETNKLKPTTLIKKAIRTYKHENNTERAFYNGDLLALFYYIEKRLKELS